MYQAIKNKEDNPKNGMYIDREYVDYNFFKNHKNIVISDVLNVIDEVILFKLSNYFLKVSRAYTELRGEEPKHDWYEFV
jgi:helicase conserved C-domain protein